MRNLRPLISIFSFILIFTSLTSVVPKQIYASGCGGLTPSKPQTVKAVSGPNAGEVTLFWDQVPYANRYAIAYGTQSHNYIYGADNIGGEQSRSYTVKSLTPGVKYYFSMAAAHDCQSSPFSSEISAVATGGTVYANPTTVYQPAVTAPSVQSYVPAQTYQAQVSASVGKQNLHAYAGPGIGEVTLNWNHADNADNYHLVYGREGGKPTYGALNIGKVNSFNVKSLVPGAQYHFALVPVVSGRALYTTPEVVVYAKAVPVEVVQVEANVIPQPTVNPAPSVSGINPPGIPVSIPEVTQPPVEPQANTEVGIPTQAPVEVFPTEVPPQAQALDDTSM
jgi:hypothetical protein